MRFNRHGHTSRRVIAGTMAATIAANLLGNRNLWGAVLFAFCNTGEAVLTAWLIANYVDAYFRLSKLSDVIGLVAAAAVGALHRLPPSSSSCVIIA